MKIVGRITNYIFNGRFKKVSRFSIVGVLNTIIDFTVFTVFNSLFGLNYAISQIAGYSFGILNSFIFNKNWTFERKKASKKTVHELLKFILVNIFSLIITIISMRVFIDNFNFNVYAAKNSCNFYSSNNKFSWL